jgi:hypothetical protein
MPKTSHQRLFPAILSASLLLATASSALADSSSSKLQGSVSAGTNFNKLEGDLSASANVNKLDNSVAPGAEQSGARAINTAARPMALASVASVASVVSVASVATGAHRAPIAYLDDLIESALHIKQSALNPGPSASTVQTLGKSAKSFVPNFFDYRPSRAAAQAFLGDSGDLSDKAADQVDDERSQRNKLALTLTATMMQIAKGLGDLDPKAAEASLQRGRCKLSELIGKGQADWVITRMSSWAEQIKMQINKQNSSPAEESDVLDQEEQVSALVSRAVARDQQISNLKALIAIHDHAPTGAERGLTLAGLTPNLIGPAAKLAQYAVERGTGGTRSKRLDDVMTLGIALQERVNLLTRESELAINNLERAKSSNNQVLYAFSKELATKLGGQ